MSNQSGEFSCVEISWEESSTKYKNFYGVVEEPKDERIIPIKIDRGISIHTASDEEDEPFWVVESVKKHEEVKNEIQKMKEDTILQRSPSIHNYDEDDKSLNELLQRVKKQRNDLEDILEKENLHTEKTVSRSNSILSEVSALKESSDSRLSSLEQNIKICESTNNSLNIHTKNKKEFSSITENISEEFKANMINNLNVPKIDYLKRHLSTDISENNSFMQNGNLDEKYSKNEDNILNPIKRISLSRLSSTEDCDNSYLSGKNVKMYSENTISEFQKSIVTSLKESDNASMLTKLNEYSNISNIGSMPIKLSKQDTINETFIPSDNNQYESNNYANKNNLVSKSLFRDKSEEYEKKPHKINDIHNDKFKTIQNENLNDSHNSLNAIKNNGLNNIKEVTKIIDSDNYELNALQKYKTEEDDNRRKSLIKQSSMLSDALNALCNETPEDYKKQKKFSIKEDSINNTFNSYLNEINENNLSKPSTQKANSTQSLQIVDDESQNYLGRKSIISKISCDKNITIPESSESKFNKENSKFEINNTPVKEKSEVLNIGTLSRSSIMLDENQKILSELENKDLTVIKKEINLTKGTSENNLYNSHDISPNSVLNINETFITNDGLLNDQNVNSTLKLLLKNNNLDKSAEEPITMKDNYKKSEIIEKDSILNNLTDTSTLSKENENIDNQTVPLKEHFVNKKISMNYIEPNIIDTNIEMSTQSTLDNKDQINENILKLKSVGIANKEICDESTCGTKQIRGIQNIKCYNYVSVVFYFLFVQNSSLFRL